MYIKKKHKFPLIIAWRSLKAQEVWTALQFKNQWYETHHKRHVPKTRALPEPNNLLWREKVILIHKGLEVYLFSLLYDEIRDTNLGEI